MLKANKDNIWRVPVYLPYLQPPLTADLIRAAEKKIGHTLPAEYLALLRVQNGGGIRFALEDKSHDFIRGIGPNDQNLTDFSWHPEVRENVGFELEGLVPFDGDGHWFLCFDYRDGPVPSICYVDVECDSQEPIADSFPAYLACLEPGYLMGTDYFVAPAVADFAAMQSKLEKSLGARFELEWGDLKSPYFSLSLKFGKSANKPQSLTLKTNMSPRGNVRKNHPQYEVLKDLLPGFAPQHPELPPGSYLFYAESDSQQALLAAGKKAGIAIYPLVEYLESITG